MSFDDDDQTTEEHERRITRCREHSCQARIVWLKTELGKNIPCDADTVGAHDEVYDAKVHVSHFKTCTAPNRFSGSVRR